MFPDYQTSVSLQSVIHGVPEMILAGEQKSGSRDWNCC